MWGLLLKCCLTVAITQSPQPRPPRRVSAANTITHRAQHADHRPAMPAAPLILPVASQRVVEDIRSRQRRRAGCREGALDRELYPPAAAAAGRVARKTQTGVR